MASTESRRFTLEFARTTQSADPFGFRAAPTDYTLRGEGGGVRTVHVPWSAALVDDLTALGKPGCPPESVQRVGNQLRTMLEPAGWPAIAEKMERALADK